MVRREKINENTAVEEIFCKPFKALPSRELSKSEMQVLTTALLVEESPLEDPFRTINSEEKPFISALVESMLESRFTFQMSNPMIFFVSLLAKNAGGCVMYLTYLQYQAKLKEDRQITAKDFCDIFPVGVPTEKSISDLWDRQKVERGERGLDSDNLLDYQTAMVSIQFTESLY